MESLLVDENRLKSVTTFPKAINLLKDKHAGKMIERHVRAMNRLANNHKSGYMLNDLLLLSELLTICNEKLKVSTEYEDALCKMISVFRFPFLKEKMSDEATFTPCVIETLSLLGRMVVTTSARVCCQIASSVGCLYEGKGTDEVQLPEAVQQTRTSYNMAMVERSVIAKAITEGIEIVGDDIPSQIEILNTLVVLSGNSGTNCDHILSANGGVAITELLMSTDDKVVFLSIEVLWNLLEKGSYLQVNKQLGTFEAARIFQKLFKHLMLNATSQQMKQMRNDFVSVVSLLASCCTSLPFVETGFLNDICDFVSATDGVEGVSTVTNSFAQFKLSYDKEDFELKKLLVCLLTSLLTLPAANVIFSERNVVQSLLSYVVPNSDNQTAWSSAQFEEIQLLCLSVLSLLSHPCITDYMSYQGNTKVLLLIDWCIKGEDFSGHGNSFHGEGGRGNKLSQLRYCLRLLLSVCSAKNESVLLDLHEQGVIPLLIGLLEQMVKRDEGSCTSSVLIEIQSDALLILSCLCQNDNHRKELFGGYEGVPVLMEFLKQSLTSSSSGLGHHRLLLSVTDCTWSAVVGNSLIEDIFFENGGIFTLMDLLQTCPQNMQGLVLGVLVDLCDNPKSLSHVTAWQGKGPTNCWSLLARLWKEEEKSLEVIRDMGALAGTTLPLVGAEQSTIGIPPLPTRQPSAAINDVSDNIRAKIYALCTKIGFTYPADKVSTEEKITLCIVENYLSFKTGEVFYEVGGELAQEGLRPTTPDQEGLQEILQSFEERAEAVIKQQHELMDEQHRADLDEEYQFYERLRDAQLSKERASEKRNDLVLRTSNVRHLKEAKSRQRAAVDASRPSAVSLGERFHTTDVSSLNVTAFCGRHVTIPSTQIKGLLDNKKLAKVN